MSDEPIIEVLEKQVAQWCVNRADAGDVTADDLVDGFAEEVKKITKEMRP